MYNEKPVVGAPGWKDTTGKHFPANMRLPDWRRYKVSGSEELTELQLRLRQIGLKNPWLRNEVWRFDRRMWLQPYDRYLFFFRTVKYGVLAYLGVELVRYTVLKDFHYAEHYEEGQDPYKLLYELQPEK